MLFQTCSNTNIFEQVFFMPFTMRYIPLILLSISILSACQSNEVMESKNVNQQEIYQYYNVLYDLSDNTFYLNAEYRVAGRNGTTLVLSEPSDIRCNQNELKLDTYLLGGAHYVLSGNTSDFKGKLELDFIDYDKKVYKNAFTTYDIDVPQITNLSMKEPTELTVSTDALQNDEKMWLRIQGDSIEHTIDMQSGKISITAEDLEGFRKKEKVYLQVTREKKGNLQAVTARGGTYSIVCCSRKVATTIQE